jgi:tetratricopeptide (TPR) repeat protein
MYKLYLFLIVLSLYVPGCKSANKAYQKGDYADAIELGVKKLQKDPNDYETKEIIQNSYTYAINEGENQVRNLSNSSDDNRYEKIYQAYIRMQDLYQTIHAYPVPAKLIKTKDYSDYIETYRNKIADLHIERAEKWMASETKDSYREAYKELATAVRYRPNDFELQRKKDTVYNRALTKVMVLPMQNYGGYQFASTSQVQNFQTDIINTLSYSLNNEFVKFYSQWESKNKNITPDQVLELNLSRLSFGLPNDNKSSREVSKEVVIKETVYKPDSVIKQYGTVKAKINTIKRTLSSEGDLVITIRDAQGKTLWNDRFTGEHSWKTEFASYTGDERALSDSDRTLLNKEEATPPSKEQITKELFKQIQNDLSNRLRTYYSR